VNVSSPLWQDPSPQTPRQSWGQELGVSKTEQTPSPQAPNAQSFGQLKMVSVSPQSPSPQKPQSLGQLGASSKNGLQIPSPHVPGQSDGQVRALSPLPQRPSPHVVVLQSWGQLARVSGGTQIRSPQYPQSVGQVEKVSFPAQILSPQ
jgi:hypothetical protein